MQKDTDTILGKHHYPPLAGAGSPVRNKFHLGVDIEERFKEDDRVIVDKGTINEQWGTISFFFGNNYCEVFTDYGDRLPVNINRLSRN